MSEATCRTCLFGRQTSGREGAEYQCRRTSPAIPVSTAWPAWPSVRAYDWCGEHPFRQRDRLAAMAMQGIAAAVGNRNDQGPPVQIATLAYEIADAMLAEAGKEPSRG